MFKKLVIASAILAVSGTSFAYNGFYAGIGAGVQHNNFIGKQIDLANGTAETDLGSNGLAGQAFVGYGQLVAPCVYLGVEGFGSLDNFSTSTFKYTNNAGTVTSDTTMRPQYSLGIRAIPGYYLTQQTMIYGIVGAVNSRFDIYDKVAETTLAKKNVWGAQAGVGMQTQLSKNVALRGDYTYTAYRSANFTANSNTASIKPNSGQYMVSLVYKFD